MPDIFYLPFAENKFINRIIRFIKTLFGFFLPGGLVFLVALGCLHQGYLDPWLSKAERLLPYVVLVIGFLLGWRFHRSRLAFVILILILAERILHYFGPDGALASGNKEAVFHTIALLLPINMVLFYLVRERGIFNLRGLLRFLFILAQPLAVALLLHTAPEVFNYLSQPVVHLALLDRFDLPQVILFINSSTIFLFLVGSLFCKEPILRGFFWALVAIAAAFLAVGRDGASTLYFCVAAFIMILSVLETAYAMAFRDELTGLPARRALNNTMDNLGRLYTIAMLDIDFFKKFNDRFGHDVGDQVLCMVASHINSVGGGGKPFRYGGEEFTIVFPGQSTEDALPHLERLRQAIAAAEFGMRGKNRPKKTPDQPKRRRNHPTAVSVTISIGAAQPGPKQAKPADVIKAADKALYRAKKKGRNCVVAW